MCYCYIIFRHLWQSFNEDLYGRVYPKTVRPISGCSQLGLMRKNLGSSGPLFLKVAPPLPRPPPLAPRPPPLPPFHTDKTRTLEREHRHFRHLPRPPLKPPPLSLPPPLPSPRPPLPLLPPPPRPRSSILNLKLEIITNSRKSQIMIRDFHCLSRSRPYRTEPAGSRKTL